MISENYSSQDFLDKFLEATSDFKASFTTPSLDFQEHAGLLNNYISKLKELKLQLQKVPFKHSTSYPESTQISGGTLNVVNTQATVQEYSQTSLTGKEPENAHERVLIIAIFEFLLRFNTLTRVRLRQADPMPIVDPLTLSKVDLAEISKHKFDPTLSNIQQAHFYLQRGRVFNLFDSFSPAAEESLIQACKWNPRNTEIWRELGESYWKKGDLNSAKDCFEWAVNISGAADGSQSADLKKSLICLAKVKRKLGGAQNCADSVELCKKALNMDLSFSEGWVGLGFSYLGVYFEQSCNIKDLQRALTAYNQAKDTQNPDMFFSRSIIYRYLENSVHSISDLETAASLDWQMEKLCRSIIYATKKYQRHLRKCFSTKLGLSDNEIDILKNRFESNMKNGKLADMPFNSVYKIPIVLQIIGAISRPHDETGKTFMAMDYTGVLCAVTLYHLKAGTVSVSDFICLDNATKFNQSLSSSISSDGNCSTRSDSAEGTGTDSQPIKNSQTANGDPECMFVRVPFPLDMSVNGKRIRRDEMEQIELKVESFPQ